jgi:hypothetical protein
MGRSVKKRQMESLGMDTLAVAAAIEPGYRCGHGTPAGKVKAVHRPVRGHKRIDVEHF